MEKIKRIEIDIEGNNIHLIYSAQKNLLTLHFNSPNRQFFLAVIALICMEMKKNKSDYIWLRQPEYLKKINKLDTWILEDKASKNEPSMMEKIRKAWLDPEKGLKNLRNAPRFRVQGRNKISPDEFGAKKEYPCKEYECDNWDMLINYEGDPSNWKYKFAVREVGLNLNDITINYNDKINQEAWQEYLKQLEKKYNKKYGIDSKFPPPLKNNYCCLTPVEHVLQINPDSEDYNTPEFFRKTGPVYSDIENGKIIIPKKVKNILKLIEQGKSVLLQGHAASGKTVLSRVVAKEWLEKQRHVLFLNLKGQQEILSLPNLLAEVENLSQEGKQPLIIIEDAHLKANFMNSFISKRKKNWPKLIVNTRKSYKDGLLKSEINSFNSLIKINVMPTISNGIIKNYYHSNKWSVSEELIEKINNISENNLWLLSYVLRSIKASDGGEIDNNSIIREVFNDLSEIAKINPLYVRLLIALSILYRFEISTDIRFLYKRFSKDPDIIENALIELASMGEVIMNQIGGYHSTYGLPHSAIADLYFQFSKNSKWEYDQLYGDEDEYIWSYIISQKAVNWASPLSYQLFDIELHKSIKSKFNVDELSIKINNSTDITKLGRVIHGTFGISTELGNELLNKIDQSALSEKVILSDDLEEIGDLISSIINCDRDSGKEFFARIGVNKLAAKIIKSNDMNGSNKLFECVAESSKDLGYELLKNFDKNLLAKKIFEEENPNYVCKCIGIALYVSQKSGYSLWKKIDKKRLAFKILELKDFESIGECLEYFSEISLKVLKQLLKEIYKNQTLLHKINTSNDLKDVSEFIESIFDLSEKDGKKLWVKIDQEKFIQKLYDDIGINDFGHLIEIFYDISTEFGENLWERIDKRKIIRMINETTDLYDLNSCIENINFASNKRGREFFDLIETDLLVKRIDETHELNCIGEFLASSIETSKETAKELATKINKEILSEKINECDDIYSIVKCIACLLIVTKELGNKLWEKINKDFFVKKYDDSHNLEKKGQCIAFLFQGSEAIGKEFWKQVDKDLLAGQIVGKTDINDSGECIEMIYNNSEEAGNDLLEKINLNDLAQKIINSNIDDAEECLEIIFGVSEIVGHKIIAIISMLSPEKAKIFSIV